MYTSLPRITIPILVVLLAVNSCGQDGRYSNQNKNPTFTVTYMANHATSGTVPSDDKSYAKGDKVIVPGNTGGLSKTGHTFAGWNTQPDGRGVYYEQGKTMLMESADMTLYAYWMRPGDLDPTFVPTNDEDGWIHSMAIQNDGKIIIRGNFLSKSIGIARLNNDGSDDSTLNLPNDLGLNDVINCLDFQRDGKIIIGGYFTLYNGKAKYGIVRLNKDGRLDNTFYLGAGADGTISSLAVQPDGKILLGGKFTTYNGTPRNNLARLNSNGNLDATFDPGTGADSLYGIIVAQSGGKTIIACSQEKDDNCGNCGSSHAENYIKRFKNNGSLDATFNHVTGLWDSPSFSIMPQLNDKILISGDFIGWNGETCTHIVRLNKDGRVDATFNPGKGADGTILSLALQSDGKILIGGEFNHYDGIARSRIARLNRNGSLDTSFDPGAGITIGTINAIAIQHDGRILIGGAFSSYNGIAIRRIARIWH